MTDVAGAPEVAWSFAEAAAHHAAGRLAEAERLYRRVLTADPDHANCLALFGMLAQQTARPELAAVCLRHAIGIEAGVASYHGALGGVLASLGQHDAAAAAFARALAIDPASADLHYNLGNALLAAGRTDEAIGSYRRAVELRPLYPDAYNNLGLACVRQRRLDVAAQCYAAALDCRADDAAALANLAALLPELEPAPEAQACANLGVAALRRGLLEDAAAWLGRAVDLQPESVEALNNLGVALRELARPEEAVAVLRRAVVLRPGFAGAWNNLGIALGEQGLREQGLDCVRKAIALQPTLAEAHVTLGVALLQERRLGEAEAQLRQATALAPEHPLANFNLAAVLLTQGLLAEGWQRSEWRWQTEQMVRHRRAFAQPQWHGEPEAGRTLLLHAEQGFGDTIQFCRYAALAAARGLRVVMEVQKPLVRLLGSLAGVDRVVARGEPLPAFDLHCPMLSMPLALGTTVENIPGASAYLRADGTQAAAWRRRLDAMPEPGLRVGLAWAGSPRGQARECVATDRRRSLPPERLRPLFATPGVQFFSLQKLGPEAPEDLPLVHLMHEMDDFADTAALVANLDLVISVDTAVAHLAGALGRPVWLLDRFDACWRWLDGRRDSPWYPALHIYRQPQPGDWDAVLAEVARDLQSLSWQAVRQHEAVA